MDRNATLYLYKRRQRMREDQERDVELAECCPRQDGVLGYPHTQQVLLYFRGGKRGRDTWTVKTDLDGARALIKQLRHAVRIAEGFGERGEDHE